MNQETIQQLRSLPIEGVAERLGLRVARHKSLCPFHDDHHASLTFNTRRNTYRCFACDAHGGTIDLVMNRLHKSFPDACRWLADSANIIVEEHNPKTQNSEFDNSTSAQPTIQNSKLKIQNSFDPSRYARHFEHPWLSDEARTFLFDERRLDPRVVRWCRLTSWTDRQGTHWLQTPFFDQSGNLIGIQNRNLDYKKQTKENLVPTNTSPSNPQSHIAPLPTGEGQGERLPLYLASASPTVPVAPSTTCPSSPCCAPRNRSTLQKAAPTVGRCSRLVTRPWQYHQPHSSPKPTRTCSATCPTVWAPPSTCIPTATPQANGSSCSSRKSSQRWSTISCPSAARIIRSIM